MAEEIDDTGFYREDFSTESDWEIFNAQLGELFQKWELSNSNWGRIFEQNELYSCKWKIVTETLELLQKEISVSYYEAQLSEPTNQEQPPGDMQQLAVPAPLHEDLMSLRNCFGPIWLDWNGSDLHTLARLYGLRRFVVMHPRELQKHFLTNRAEFSFFLSSATVVAAEICAAVPVFVQIYDPKWNYFVGVGLAPTLRTNFDLVALEQTPNDLRYLCGLLAMFKDKLPATYLRPATVSVRTTFAFLTVRIHIPMYLPFVKVPADNDASSFKSSLSTACFTALPHGYFQSAYTNLYSVFTWPEIAENMAIDSALHSDFVPTKAHNSHLYLTAKATSYLSSCLRDYQKLATATQSLESYVGRNFSGTASAAETSNPLDLLTEPHFRHLRSTHQRRDYAVNKQSPQKKLPGPMNENELNQMLYYLFPDIHPDFALFPYSKTQIKQEFDPLRIKSANPDSLVCRLSCLLATCNGHFGGKNGLAQLWAAFTRELRFIWDYCLTIPGVSPGFPDTRSCLLHQKLQMLNICMERREMREFGGKPDAPKQTLFEVTSDDEEEDEFYECDEETVNKPEGRQQRLGEMTLLDSDEPLFVPVTQDPVPKTEDQLHDDAEVMLKLGPGSGIMTQMMCSSLLSDMEAFKAANPKSKIEDFIRWYSPKDWEETENADGEVEGKLSARMLAPDNTWQTVWKQAKSVPAWRQKRLFDDTNEALKVLHYLETRTIGEIYEMTVVPLLHSAILKIEDLCKNANVFDILSPELDILFTDLCRISRDIDIIGSTESDAYNQTPNFDPLLKKIEALELQLYQHKSLQHLPAYPLYKEMLKNGGNGPLSLNKKDDENLFSSSEFTNDKLISKEYVIRVDGETTSSAKGKMGPQYLRAIVTGEKIRLCGAFTENTTFV